MFSLGPLWVCALDPSEEGDLEAFNLVRKECLFEQGGGLFFGVSPPRHLVSKVCTNTNGDNLALLQE